MKKHLVIFAPIVQWPIHFETDLELAQRHLDEGGEVTFLACRGAFPVCAQNPQHRKSICRKCVSRFESGMRWLGRERVTVLEFQRLTPEQQETVDALSAASFCSLEELKEFKLEGSPLGLAAFGSVASYLREPMPDHRKHEALFTAHLKTAAISFFSLRNQLSSLAPEAFMLFNGRFAEMRAALFAAQSLAIPAFVHERAGVLERYSLFCNATPHDIAAMKESIDETCADPSYSDEEKKRIASEWYDERRNNKAQSWYSFTANQQQGMLPDFSRDLLNVVIFNSSDDENEAFPEWRNPLYPGQKEGVERIVADLREDGRFKVFLRVHPNLSNVANSQTEGIRELEEALPDLTVIAADSPMGSYGILDACDIAVVFGSTIGIEAVRSGKPTFLLGRSFYEDLQACVTPRSHEEFIRLLVRYADGDRSMLPPEDAAQRAVVKFAFHQKLWGDTYRYVRPYHIGKAMMLRNGKETRLRPSLVSWLWERAVSYFAG